MPQVRWTEIAPTGRRIGAFAIDLALMIAGWMGVAFAVAVGYFIAEGLPENGTIPLHDHPGMTVVSKLLYGRVRVRSYDWVKTEDEDARADVSTRVPRLARLVADREIQPPSPPFSLYPSDANVHTFHALTDAALLDVLAPPYAFDNGRDCHYFAEVPRGPNGEACGENEAWLLETECPESFEVNRGTYLGPKVGSEAEAG